MIITGNHETTLVMGLIITTIIITFVMATWILVVGLHCMSIRFMLVDLPPVMPATPIKRRNTSSCYSIDPYSDLMNGAASPLFPSAAEYRSREKSLLPQEPQKSSPDHHAVMWVSHAFHALLVHGIIEDTPLVSIVE